MMNREDYELTRCTARQLMEIIQCRVETLPDGYFDKLDSTPIHSHYMCKRCHVYADPVKRQVETEGWVTHLHVCPSCHRKLTETEAKPFPSWLLWLRGFSRV